MVMVRAYMLLSVCLSCQWHVSTRCRVRPTTPEIQLSISSASLCRPKASLTNRCSHSLVPHTAR